VGESADSSVGINVGGLGVGITAPVPTAPPTSGMTVLTIAVISIGVDKFEGAHAVTSNTNIIETANDFFMSHLLQSYVEKSRLFSHSFRNRYKTGKGAYSIKKTASNSPSFFFPNQ